MNQGSDYPGAEAIVDLMGIQPGEKVLILSDERISEEPLQIMVDAIRRSGALSVVKRNLPSTFVEELPPFFEDLVQRVDVVLFAASHSFYHTALRKRAKKEWGKRVAECYGIVKESLAQGGLTADPVEVARRGRDLWMRLRESGPIRITTSAGTDFSFHLRHAGFEKGCYRTSGSGGNLPAGEVFLIPVPKSAHGRIRLDLSMDMLGSLRDKPLTIEVREGKVESLSGPKAFILEDLIQKDNRIAQLSEIGLGTNPSAKLGRNVLEDEKVYGTCHVGFGNDTYFGGENGGPHIDGVFRTPTLELDEGRNSITFQEKSLRI